MNLDESHDDKMRHAAEQAATTHERFLRARAAIVKNLEDAALRDDHILLAPTECRTLLSILAGGMAADPALRLDPQRRGKLARFQDAGLLWLCNTAILHPRGWALALHVTEDGEPTGLSIVGDGDEPWCFGTAGDADFEAVSATVDGYFHAEAARERAWSPKLRGAVATPEGDYTDRHLLEQIGAEIDTALDLNAGETTLRTMLEGFRRKIALQTQGLKWWER